MIGWFRSKKRKDKNLSQKDDFVSLSSHELRTPLSVVKWYSEMLLDGDAGPLTEDQRKYLLTIQSSNQQAIDLVRSLLNVSRLDLGTFCISPEEVSLLTAVEDIVVSLSSALEEKQITIEKRFKELPKTFITDKKMLSVALHEILDNAIKFSPASTSIVLVSQILERGETVSSYTPKERTLLLSVASLGDGIPHAEQHRIFTKMFKGKNNKDSKGSGLGLYIARGAIRSLGGEVWFSSYEKKGVTFYIAVPLTVDKKEGKTRLD